MVSVCYSSTDRSLITASFIGNCKIIYVHIIDNNGDDIIRMLPISLFYNDVA